MPDPTVNGHTEGKSRRKSGKEETRDERAEKRRRLEEAGNLPRLTVAQEHVQTDGGLYCPVRMLTMLPPSSVQGKLLTLPTTLAEAKARHTTLDIEFRVPLLSEHEHGLFAFDLLDPASTEGPADGDALSVAGSRPGGRMERKQPEEGGFLRNAGYIQNDVYTLRNNFLTGHEGAEKKLHRARPPEVTLEGALERIEQTFREAQKDVRAHPKNPALRPVRVSPLLPDIDQAHRSFLLVEFDEKPTTTPVPVVLVPAPGGPESKPTYVAYKGAEKAPRARRRKSLSSLSSLSSCRPRTTP